MLKSLLTTIDTPVRAHISVKGQSNDTNVATCSISPPTLFERVCWQMQVGLLLLLDYS